MSPVKLLLPLLGPLLWVIPAHAGEINGTVEIPLDDLLQMRTDEPPPAPAVVATVDALTMEGRLLGDAIEIDAQVTVTVLTKDRWVEVPFLDLGPSATLTALPQLDSGAVRAQGGQLSLVTRDPGRVSFSVSFVQRAREEGDKRRVDLGPQPAAVSSLRLRFDEGLFHLLDDTARSDGDSVVLRSDRVVVNWQTRGPILAQRIQRARVEPAIPTAHVSVVSTQGGQRILRARYALRFDGTAAIGFSIPSGQLLEHVYLNGGPIPFDVDGGRVEVQVEPVRAGDQSATVELVTRQERAETALSGNLRLEAPAARWPVDAAFVTLHLPDVFNYRWIGGSLAPWEGQSTAGLPESRFSYTMPEPGKTLTFHQYLVGDSAPEVEITYAVDLAGSYFHK